MQTPGEPLPELLAAAPLPTTLLGNVIVDEALSTCYLSDLTAQRPEWISWKRKASMLGYTLEIVIDSVDHFKERQGSSRTTRNSSGDSEMQARVIRQLANAAALNSSDVHLHTNLDSGQAQFRIHGDLERQAPQERAIAEAMMNVVMNSMIDQGASGNKDNEMQYARLAGRFNPPGVGGVRISVSPIVDGRWMNFRLLRDSNDGITGSLEERLLALGFSEVHTREMREIADRTQGIMLIVGTTGDGKSTTLKHYFEAIAAEFPGENLVSIEDPVETRINGVKQQSVNHAGFASANEAFNEHVRFILRADPDRALIGELRDKETFQLAITKTRTGHPVAATMHTTRWYGAIDRMADELRSPEITDPHSYLLKSELFSGFIYQVLTKKICPSCGLDAHEYRQLIPVKVQRSLAALLGGQDFSGVKLINREGCDSGNCRAGVVDRTVIAEVVPTTPLLLEVLREQGTVAGVDYWKNTLGGQSIYDHAREKLLAGVIDPMATTSSLGHLDREIKELEARASYAKEQAL